MCLGWVEWIYREHYKLLLKRAIVILKDMEQSEDIVHDVFLRVLDQPSILDSVSDQKAYLLRSVTNAAINRLKANHKLLEYHETLTVSTVDGTHDHFLELENDRSLIKQRVQYLMKQLPPRQQLIYRLSRYEGLDHEEISGYLNISKHTVKNQIVKAHHYLSTSLKTVYIISSPVYKEGL